MKNSVAESQKQLPAALDSAVDAVCDFLYIDRPRVSALYAQLFPQGTLTSVKTTSQQGFSDDSNIGTDVKIFKAETKSIESGSEGIEHVFDASWAVPSEVLSRLSQLALIRDSMKDPKLGAVVLLETFLRIIDYATMKDMWEPAMAAFAGDTPGMKELVAFLKSVPHTMHAHFLSHEGLLWASLDPANLTVPSADIVLKHGGSVSGRWKVLFLLDAFPDVETSDSQVISWSAGQATDAVLNAINVLRTQIGRPPHWFGITPLMIYREIPPYAGQESLDLG